MLWCIDFGNLQFGDIGDSRFNNWVLEYFYITLSNQSPSFKTSNFFYPLINNILLSDNHWLIGIFYSFFRFLDFDSHSSYSIILILESIINFISCYYVLRKFNISKNSSAIGAFIFSFNTIIAIKISHSQLHFKAFILLAILFVFQYFKKRDFKYIALTLLSVVLQLMVSSYNGMFLIIFLIIIILTILSNYKFTDFKNFLPIKYSYKTSVLLILLSLILLSIYAIPYKETINIYNFNIPIILEKFQLNSILIPKDSQFIKNFLDIFSINIPNMNGENNLFIGFGVLIIIFLSLFNKKFHQTLNFTDKKIFFATFFTIIFFLIDSYVPTFYFFQLYLPGFNNLRAPSRFYFVVFFGIIFATAKFLNYLEITKNYKLKIIYYILVLLILFEAVSTKYHFSNHKSQEKYIKQYQELANKYGSPDSILLFTFSNDFLQNHDYIVENINILWAFLKNPELKIINGYTGHIILELNIANNCLDAQNIIIKNEKEINKIFKNNFKYDRKKLIILHDNKICKQKF